MNAPFDPVSFIHRLEAEGIARGAPEAIAQGIEDRNRELATRADVNKLDGAFDKVRNEMATKVDVRGLGGSVDKLDEKFDKLEGKFDKLEGKFDRLEGRVGKLEGKVDKLEGTVDRLENTVDKIGGEIDKMRHEMATKADLERYATKDELNAALAKLVTQVGGMLAGSIALTVAILGTIIALR